MGGQITADHRLIHLGGDPRLVGVALPHVVQHIIDILANSGGSYAV